MSKKPNKIDSLPDRPLTITEADELVESGEFAPLTVKSELVEEVPYADNVEKEIAEKSVYFVHSLLHATEERGISLAYSGVDGHWVRAVKMEADGYDHQELEKRTHEFVKSHSETSVDFDAGLVNIDEVDQESNE